MQTQAASLAASGVGGYQPYLGQAATQGTQAISTLGGVSPYISVQQDSQVQAQVQEQVLLLLICHLINKR